MRISDWSSDVCSSDLADLFANRHLGKPRLIAAVEQAVGILNRHHARAAPLSGEREDTHHAPGILVGEADMAHLAGLHHRIARVQAFLDRRLDRKSVVWGKSVSVRVDPGGRPTINKKK